MDQETWLRNQSQSGTSLAFSAGPDSPQPLPELWLSDLLAEHVQSSLSLEQLLILWHSEAPPRKRLGQQTKRSLSIFWTISAVLQLVDSARLSLCLANKFQFSRYKIM